MDHKEGWVLKNWCFWTVVLEKTLESPWDSKEIKLVNSKGNQPWIFIGRIDAEAEAPILWPSDSKSQLIGKDSGAGKIEGRRRRGWQRMRWLNGIIESMDMSLSKFWEMVKEREAWHTAVSRVTKTQTQLSTWKTIITDAETTTWEVKLLGLDQHSQWSSQAWIQLVWLAPLLAYADVCFALLPAEDVSAKFLSQDCPC